MRIDRVLLPSLLACFSACAVDADVGNTTSTEQALTYNSLWWSTCAPSNMGCPTFNVGINNAQVEVAKEVCVLAGLSGDFHHEARDNDVGAEVFKSPSLWAMFLRRSYLPSPQPEMSAAVECFNGNGNTVTELTWKSGDSNSAMNMTPTARDRQCFLSEVYNTSPTGFKSYNDIVQVHIVAGQWVLDGTTAQGATLSAKARCYSGIALVSTMPEDTRQADHAITPDGHGIACAITMIGGILNTGHVTGAYVSWHDSPNQFFVHKDPQTRIGWSCVQ